MSFVFQVSLFFVPWALRRLLLIHVYGWKIDRMAYIGMSFVGAVNLSMGPGSKIGSLNYFRGMRSVILGAESTIGNMNWITASMMQFDGGILDIGDQSSITNRHYLDCNGGVFVARFSTIAGVKSQIWTHSVDIKKNCQSVSPVHISEYCFVGSGVILLPGSTLPAMSILSAGSVKTRVAKLEGAGGLYVGNPAIRVKEIGENYAYFSRKEGVVK